MKKRNYRHEFKSSYRWKFVEEGGGYNVSIRTGADIAHLSQLDYRFWAVQACPATGLEMDERTLRFMDTGNDGRISPSEVVAASQWLREVLVDMDYLFKRVDHIGPSRVRQETQEGSKVARAIGLVAGVRADGEEEGDFRADLRNFVSARVADPGVGDAERREMQAMLDALKAKKEGGEAEVSLSEVMAYKAREGEEAAAAVEPLERLLCYCRDYVAFLGSYVSFSDFYRSGEGRQAIFQAGSLLIGRRRLELCVRVDSMERHPATAGRSGLCLLYCRCTARNGGGQMDIAAALTRGSAEDLYEGQNAVFRDREGGEYDAVVTKIVGNPTSMGQVLMELLRLSGRRKGAAGAEAGGSVQGWVPAGGDANGRSDGMARPVKRAAALGLAAGFLGGLAAASAGRLALWLLVGCLAAGGGLALLRAWLRLRFRDFGPVLNASGWAVNSRMGIGPGLGAALATEAVCPKPEDKGAHARKDNKVPGWVKVAAGSVAVAAVVFAVLCLTRSMPWQGYEVVPATAEEAVVGTVCDSLPEAGAATGDAAPVAPAEEPAGEAPAMEEALPPRKQEADLWRPARTPENETNWPLTDY